MINPSLTQNVCQSIIDLISYSIIYLGCLQAYRDFIKFLPGNMLDRQFKATHKSGKGPYSESLL